MTGWPPVSIYLWALLHSPHASLTCVSIMANKFQRSKGPSERVLSTLNVAIDDLGLAKEAASATPTKAAFGTAAITRLTSNKHCNRGDIIPVRVRRSGQTSGGVASVVP